MILGFKTMHNGKPTHFPEKILSGAKIHTIRKDEFNRWKQGNLIQFATGVRTKKYNCFHEQFCNGTQKIHIEPEIGLVFVDDKPLTLKEIKILAINDGFDSLVEFFNWFNEEFTGKIIHFTNKRY